jgi:hypothetical protein
MADVYDGKSLQDLLKDILVITATKRSTINSIINDLRQYVNTAEDAAVFAPIIKDFIDVSVKNDDQLVKVGTIVQRVATNEKSGGGSLEDLLSDEEKAALVRSAVQEKSPPKDLMDSLDEALDKKK